MKKCLKRTDAGVNGELVEDDVAGKDVETNVPGPIAVVLSSVTLSLLVASCRFQICRHHCGPSAPSVAACCEERGDSDNGRTPITLAALVVRRVA